MASRRQRRARARARRHPVTPGGPHGAARRPSPDAPDAPAGRVGGVATRAVARLARLARSRVLGLGLVGVVAAAALRTNGAPWWFTAFMAVLVMVIVAAVTGSVRRLEDLLGPITAWAGVAVAAGTLFSLVAWAAPTCPSGGSRRCDLAEAGSWWLDGALLVAVVGGVIGVVRLVGRLASATGRATAAGTRSVAPALARAVRDAATRRDGLFRRPPWRDPLVGSGLVVAAVAGIGALVGGHDGTTASLAALAGFVAGGTVPAAWRFSSERPETVAANRARRRERGRRRR